MVKNVPQQLQVQNVVLIAGTALDKVCNSVAHNFTGGNLSKPSTGEYFPVQ